MSATLKKIAFGGHRGLGCTDADFFSFRDLATMPVENSLASITAAFKAGADFIETDAVMSCDGEIFLLHNVKPEDHFFGKTRPLKNLNKLNFDSFKNCPTGRSKNGSIATLKDLLKLLPELDPKTIPFALNLEIKGVQGSNQNYESNDFLKNIAKTVLSSNYPPSRILFSSFCLENILRLSKLIPDANFGILFSENDQKQAIYADNQDSYNFNYLPSDLSTAKKICNLWQIKQKLYFIPEATKINPKFIEYAVNHSAGIISWTWQERINSERLELYKKLATQINTAGLSYYVITDYINEIKPLLPA